MAKTFRCTIVTPSDAVFDDEVTYVSMPAWDGQLGVMHGQSPLLTRLGIGPMKVELPSGTETLYLLDGGFAQIHENELTILTEKAVPSTDLSVEEARDALADANSRAVAGGENRDRVEADQQRARISLALSSG